jgi:plasmid replication initiation protein
LTDSNFSLLPLLPERHPEKDFFMADIFDSLPIKDDMASMEHPIFTLSKKKDIRNLEYTNGNVSIQIKPNTDGLPTIFDKDVLLYCASLLMAEVNKGIIPPKTLRISSHDLMVATNRQKSGEGYALLKKALDRLQGVSIKTNIKTNKREITSAFGLIESYEIIESSKIKNRMVRLEITLSDWFYNSIIGKEVLTISRDYFRLGKALERRLYELARKHCGKQQEWSVSLSLLHQKTGSQSSPDKFRYFTRGIAETNHLPDYTIALLDNDVVLFQARREKKAQADLFDLPFLSQDAIRKGAEIVHKAGTGWDYNEIRSQFTTQLIEGFKPKNVNGAFINFVKKKVAVRP